MNEPDWTQQIDALLDGELSPEQARTLHQAAAADPRIAREMEHARQLQQLLAGMPARRAPRRLQRRLLGIADEETAVPYRHWAFRGALLACLPLLFVVANLREPAAPSEAQVIQGQRDLAVALSYLGKASHKTQLQIRSTLGSAMLDPVTRSTVETLKVSIDLPEEYLL